MTGRLAELTFTLTAFDTIDKVKLEVGRRTGGGVLFRGARSPR